MSWLTVAWSMAAAAACILALMYLAIWFQQPRQRAYLLFSLTALGAAGNAVLELLMMHAQTVATYAAALRWSLVPQSVLVVSMAWFVRAYFGTGRRWLALVVTCLWTLTLLIDFYAPHSIVYTEITGLRTGQTIWGETFSVAHGVYNPWNHIPNLGVAFLVAFVIDASLRLWWKGDRRRAAVIGGSITFFVLVAVVQASLVDTGVVRMPYAISLNFLIIVMTMGYELSRGVGQAARLADELRASEARLHESEQRMELAASAAELGLWTWDVAGDEIWSTEKGRALFGFSSSEPLDFGRFVGRLHPDDREPVRQAVARSLEGGGDYEREYRILPPNAPMRWIAARGRVELDAGGRPLRMRGISLDITRHKHAELEVQHQRKELAHLARVTLLGELSGSLAHELNQPLTAILSNAQAAQRFLPKGSDEPDDELREILTDIVAEAKRAGEVIQRLRLLLKKGEVQQRPLDVNEVAQDVLKIAHSDLVNHNIRLTTALAPGPPAVNGDRVQLQQVLLNLVVNSCDAMTEAAPSDREIVVTQPTRNRVPAPEHRMRQSPGSRASVSTSKDADSCIGPKSNVARQHEALGCWLSRSAAPGAEVLEVKRRDRTGD